MRLPRSRGATRCRRRRRSSRRAVELRPARVVYEWGFVNMGNIGWGVAFLYCVFAALRLARFNTNLEVADKRYFQGLPSPAAAALVTGFVWTMDDYALDPETYRWWALAV